MKIKVNKNFENIKETYLFSEIASRVKKYQQENPDKKIIRMGIGDVTLPLPKIVVDALRGASAEMGVKETFRGYPPEYGYDFLKEAISEHYKQIGVNIPSASVYVSDGAKSDLGNIVDILGDNEIVIPDPVYPVYVDSNLMSGHKITLIEGNIDNGFLPLPDQIAHEVEGAVIYLCSPNNPTGAVYSHEGLKAWVDYALKTGSMIIYDSAYEAFVVEDVPHTIYEIEGADQCAIEICSFSKFAGFTGVRCGWTVIPAGLEADGIKISKLWSRRQATKFNGVSYPVQRAAESALSTEGKEACAANIAYYRKNASMLAVLLKSKDIKFTGGVNSPYIWLQCPKGMSSWEFFDFLLNEAQIVGTPGEGFGKSGEGFFRLTAFGTNEATKEACERLDKLL